MGAAACGAESVAGAGTLLFPTSRGRREGMDTLVTGGEGLGDAVAAGLADGGIGALAL